VVAAAKPANLDAAAFAKHPSAGFTGRSEGPRSASLGQCIACWKRIQDRKEIAAFEFCFDALICDVPTRYAALTMQAELAKVMDVGQVTLGGLIDRLEASGLVKRTPDPIDRRAKRVQMTPKGMRLLAEIQ
jgi:hypothetical protein